MPLILISGYPCSGKSHRARQLASYFTTRISAATTASGGAAPAARLTVRVIDDNDFLGVPRTAFRDARDEKTARAAFYSAVKRALARDVVVVADGLNYIKGYRYQLYCEAKAVRTPSCVVHVGTPVETCRAINDARNATADGSGQPPAEASSAVEVAGKDAGKSSENNQNDVDSADDADAAPKTPPSTTPAPYPSEDFENLIFRYEEPNGMTRWDSPLFTVPYSDPDPPYDAIWDALVGPDADGGGGAGSGSGLKTVKPNQATVLKPAAPQNYLQALDRLTTSTIAAIQAHYASLPDPDSAPLPFALALGLPPGISSGAPHHQQRTPAPDAAIVLPAGPCVPLPRLQRLRRQFVQMNRASALPIGDVGEAWVRFLNDALADGEG